MVISSVLTFEHSLFSYRSSRSALRFSNAWFMVKVRSRSRWFTIRRLWSSKFDFEDFENLHVDLLLVDGFEMVFGATFGMMYILKWYEICWEESEKFVESNLELSEAKLRKIEICCEMRKISEDKWFHKEKNWQKQCELVDCGSRNDLELDQS